MAMPRRSAGHHSGHEKMMYGSNSSIQSAPHFNYDSMSVLMKSGGSSGGVVRGRTGAGMMMDTGLGMGMGMTGQQLSSDPYNLAQGGRGGAMMKSVFSFDRITGQTMSSSGHGQGDLGPAFKWPEKIHASTVKQNDMFWNKCRELKQQHQQGTPRYMDSSSSSSGNTVNFPGASGGGIRGYANTSPLQMPPSPARD